MSSVLGCGRVLPGGRMIPSCVGSRPQRQLFHQARLRPRASNPGKDVLGSFVDLANFVSADGMKKKLNAFEDLAYKMGGEVYVDVNGWHLYVKDIKVGGSSEIRMHNVLAQQIGEKVVASGRVDEAEIKAVMKAIPLDLGGGKVKVSLLDSIGKTCMYDLTRAIEEWMDDR